jgi:hypothetical protein
MAKEYTLHSGTVRLIKEVVSIGGWNVDITDTYYAGKLVDELPEPAVTSKETALAPVTVTISDKQAKIISKAFKFHSEKGAIPPSPFAIQVIETFDLLK